MKRIGFLVVFSLLLALIASGGKAGATPDEGWTAQSLVNAGLGAARCVDVEVANPYVWVAWVGGNVNGQYKENAVFVARSTDYGATWDTPIVIEDGSYTVDPRVKLIYGTRIPGGSASWGALRLIYASTHGGADGYPEVWIARSDDLGATWPTDKGLEGVGRTNTTAHRWRTGSTAWQYQVDADYLDSENSILFVCTQKPTPPGGYTQIACIGYITAGGDITPYPTEGGDVIGYRLSPDETRHHDQPAIACMGGGLVNYHAVVVWKNSGTGGATPWTISSSMTNKRGASWTTPYELLDSDGKPIGNLMHELPSIDWNTNFPTMFCDLKDPSTGNYYLGRYYMNTEFKWFANNGIRVDQPGADPKIESTGANTPPYPSCDGPSGWECVFHRDGSKRPKLRAKYISGQDIPQYQYVDMLGPSKEIKGSAWCIDVNNTYHEKVFAGVTTEGEIYFKRYDTTNPKTARLTKPEIGEGDTLYLNKDFEVQAEGEDNFAVNCTDLMTGMPVHKGIAKITYEYTEDQNTYKALPTVEGTNISYEYPYALTAKSSALNGKRIKIRTTAEDSAGNTLSSDNLGWLVVDTTPPTVTLETDTQPNADGWRNKETTVTLSVNDKNPDKTYYRLEKLSDAGRGSGWVEYTSPFKLGHGEWKITYYTVDKAQNKSDEREDTIRIDLDKPEAFVLRPAKDVIQTGYYSDDTFRISGCGTDANKTKKIELLWDGKVIASAEEEKIIKNGLPELIDLEKQERGYHKVGVRVTDIAGNETLAEKQVWVGPYASNWYFAEGNTLNEFEEYVCLFNPGDEPLSAKLTFMLESGQNIEKTIQMNPRQRLTYRVKDIVPEGHPGVSLWVNAYDKAVVVERPVYFKYEDKWDGGHICSGVNVLQKVWYFGEGTTRYNGGDGYFRCWLTVMNTNDVTADISVDYLLDGGQVVTKGYSVRPRSRETINVNGDVGPDRDVSIKVTSSVPVAVERPMYFNYHTFALGGSDVSGVSSAQKSWNFAEGCTRAGYQEWISIQNPNDIDANVSFTYYTGQGRMATSKHVIGAHSRETINVATEVGDSEDVSTSLTSDIPVIAERPMYYLYGLEKGLTWDGGDCVVGNPSPSTIYYLAEGTTIPNFDTFYSLFNPREDKTAIVDVEYVFGDGSTRKAEYQIPPHSRLTLNVRDATGVTSDVSATVVTSFPCLIERPIYFNYSGYKGGHDSQGYGVD